MLAVISFIHWPPPVSGGWQPSRRDDPLPVRSIGLARCEGAFDQSTATRKGARESRESLGSSECIARRGRRSWCCCLLAVQLPVSYCRQASRSCRWTARLGSAVFSWAVACVCSNLTRIDAAGRLYQADTAYPTHWSLDCVQRRHPVRDTFERQCPPLDRSLIQINLSSCQMAIDDVLAHPLYCLCRALKSSLLAESNSERKREREREGYENIAVQYVPFGQGRVAGEAESAIDCCIYETDQTCSLLY